MVKVKPYPFIGLFVRCIYSREMTVEPCVILNCCGNLRNATMGKIPQTCATVPSLDVSLSHQRTIADKGKGLKFA